MGELRPLLFLLKLAWDCRYRLPLLITVGFMVLDVRMQLDINVQMRPVPRPVRNIRRQPNNLPQQQQQQQQQQENEENPDNLDENLSDSSWTTFEEQEVGEDDLAL